MNPGIKDIIQRYHCPSELKNIFPIFSGTVLHAGQASGTVCLRDAGHEGRTIRGLFYPPEGRGRRVHASTSLG